MKLYHFTAKWCKPCEKIAPIIEEFILENPNIDYIKIDVDDQSYVAHENNVMSIPTLIVKDNGVEIKRHKGVATKQDIRNLFE
jgi:thiol-disulfide isomerase/thioredoxin